MTPRADTQPYMQVVLPAQFNESAQIFVLFPVILPLCFFVYVPKTYVAITVTPDAFILTTILPTRHGAHVDSASHLKRDTMVYRFHVIYAIQCKGLS